MLDFLGVWPENKKKPNHGWQFFKKDKGSLFCLDSKKPLAYDIWEELIGEIKPTAGDKTIKYRDGYNIFLNHIHALRFKKAMELDFEIIPVEFDGINCFGVKAVKDKKGRIILCDVVVTSERYVQSNNITRVLFSLLERYCKV